MSSHTCSATNPAGVAGCVAVIAVFLWALLTASQAVRVRADPRQCFAPCELRLSVRVYPHPDNRELWTALVDEGGIRSMSARTLDGADTLPEYVYSWRLGPGEYLAGAVVRGSQGERGRDQVSVSVR